MKSFVLTCLCVLAMILAARHAAAFAPPAAHSTTKAESLIITHARPQTRFREVQGNILTRRTINEFDPKLPSHWEKALERAIEAAIYAPNHKRTEPWRFYLLGKNSIEKVCKLNAELVSLKKGEAAGEKKLDDVSGFF